jgi:hypothetical protein
MSTVAMSGNDSVIMNGRIFRDFGDGDFAQLEFPNEIAQVKTGKNGNSIYSINESGKQASLKLKVIRGSADDKYLQQLLNLQNIPANFPATVLSTGTLVKNIGDGQGNVSQDTYVLSGGIFTKIPGAKSNAEGDVEQSTVMYEMKFSNAPRVLT